jgi:hypothetical protein|nr:MAG TPA: hypothetical protein [Caudoviricetes sp.]
MELRPLIVWQVVDSYGEYEDYNEVVAKSFTCPVFAGLCLGRHRDRQTALESSNEWSDYNGTFLRSVDVHLVRREENGCLRFL